MNVNPKHVYALVFNKKHEYATLIWYNHVTREQLQAVYTRVIEFIQTRKVTKLIEVVYYSSTLLPSEQEWFVTDVLPRLFQAGLHSYAALIPDSLAVIYIYDRILEKLKPNETDMRYFHTFDEAESWLQEIKSSSTQEAVEE